jgi:hypothetical protein
MRLTISHFSRFSAMALVALALATAPAVEAGQNPIATFTSNPGGSRMAFNITAIGQIKAAPGKLRRLFVQTAASAGTLILSDVCSGGTPAIGNQVAAIPNTALTAGAVITIDAPFAACITVSGTWPTALVLSASYD